MKYQQITLNASQVLQELEEQDINDEKRTAAEDQSQEEGDVYLVVDTVKPCKAIYAILVC